jgi:D-alanyl-D-alanine carboxypeptidase
MNQRMALILAGGLTAFMLVVVGAVATTVMMKPAAVVNAQAPVAAQPASAISVQLSPAQAAQIASNAVPGATLTNTPDLVSFQGTVAYEVILNQGTIYVDANTGQVLYNGVAASGSALTGSTSGERHRDGGSNQLFGGHDD